MRSWLDAQLVRVVAVGVLSLCIGVILGMEFVTIAAYHPTNPGLVEQSRPAWVGLVEAIRLWMAAGAVGCLGVLLGLDIRDRGLGFMETGNR